MARVLDPKCRQCRRVGIKLYLKGLRCETPKCPMEKPRRSRPPGQHGEKRKRPTEFGIHLREVQRLKRHYGVMDRQLRRYYAMALREANTGEAMLQFLESRLDNVVFRLGFAQSRAQARQWIRHGHYRLNGKRATIPSQFVDVGDVVTAAPGETGIKLAKESIAQGRQGQLPSWLSRTEDPPEGRMVNKPVREEVSLPVEDLLVVEFLGR